MAKNQKQKKRGKVYAKVAYPLTQIVRKITIVQVAVCAVLVAVMVFLGVFFQRDAVAGRSLNKMARDYYEDYFYEEFLHGREADAEIFEYYAKFGFPTITLRQLLVHTGDEDLSGKFTRCDKMRTTVKITPVEPFGKSDYTLETSLDCE